MIVDNELELTQSKMLAFQATINIDSSLDGLGDSEADREHQRVVVQQTEAADGPENLSQGSKDKTPTERNLVDGGKTVRTATAQSTLPPLQPGRGSITGHMAEAMRNMISNQLSPDQDQKDDSENPSDIYQDKKQAAQASDSNGMGSITKAPRFFVENQSPERRMIGVKSELDTRMPKEKTLWSPKRASFEGDADDKEENTTAVIDKIDQQSSSQGNAKDAQEDLDQTTKVDKINRSMSANKIKEVVKDLGGIMDELKSSRGNNADVSKSTQKTEPNEHTPLKVIQFTPEQKIPD